LTRSSVPSPMVWAWVSLLPVQSSRHTRERSLLPIRQQGAPWSPWQSRLFVGDCLRN